MLSLPFASILLILSALGLWLGAELLVRHCVRLATSLAIPTTVIAITLIAAGTSLPELATNVVARIENAPSALTLGSAIGSNIANIALILGSCMLLFPIEAHQSQKRQIGLLALLTLFFGLTMARATIGRYEGAFLIVIGLFALLQPWLASRKNQKAPPEKEGRPWLSSAFIAAGGTFVILGAWGFVEGALAFAKHMGLSYHFVAITIVALGTSLPEWITSLVAGYRKDHAFIISQLVGSNLFNMLTIIGVSALIRPLCVERVAFVRDWGVMALVTALLWFWRGKKPLPKSLGLLFLGIYVFYIWISA